MNFSAIPLRVPEKRVWIDRRAIKRGYISVIRVMSYSFEVWDPRIYQIYFSLLIFFDIDILIRKRMNVH